MSLLLNEWKKIYKNKGFLTLILALFACNTLFAFWVIDYESENGYSIRQEAELLQEVEQTGGDYVTRHLEEKEADVREELQSIMENGREQPASQGTDSPGRRVDILLREQVFLRQMLALSRQNDEYTDILYALSAQEDGIAASSLVNENRYYQMQNDMIRAMYGALPVKEINLLPSEGIELLTGFSFTDAALLLFSVVLVMQIVGQEYTGGMMSLIRYTKNGFENLLFSKIWISVILTLFVSGIFYMGSFLILWFEVGGFQLSEPIQAVGAYLLSPYFLSVGQFLAICYLWKMVALILWTLISFCLALLFRKSMCIVIAALGMGLEQFMVWNRIDYGMWYDYWKEWSVFAMLTPDHYYRAAVCVNFLGRPIEIWTAGAAFAAFAFLAVIVGIIIIWKKQSLFSFGAVCPKKKKRRQYKIREKLESFEIRRLVWMCGAGMLLFVSVGANYLLNRLGDRYSDTEGYYHFFCECIEGQTLSQAAEILSEERIQMDENSRIVEENASKYASGEISLETFQAIRSYYEVPEGKEIAYQKVTDQVRTVRGRFPEGEKAGIFYETGWEKVLGANLVKNILVDLLVFLIPAVLGIAQWSTMEYQYQMTPLVVTKRLGRREYRRSMKRTVAFWGGLGMLLVCAVRIVAVQMDYTLFGGGVLFFPVKSFSFWNFVYAPIQNMPVVLVLVVVLIVEIFLGVVAARVVLFVADRRRSFLNALFMLILVLLLPLGVLLFML